MGGACREGRYRDDSTARGAGIGVIPYPHIIAVGGLGGSGTRVIARMLQLLDIYVGGSLNSKLDNLWFTLLFKRTTWFRAMPEPYDFFFALRMFRRAMEDGLAGNLPREAEERLRTIKVEARRTGESLGLTATTLEEFLSSRRYDRRRFRGWGWKEPNTHVFLPQIAAAFPNLKYVHVIRNGLDMAFSSNQQQLANWGALIGRVDVDGVRLSPKMALDFWIAANRRATDIGNVLGPDMFHLLNYDRLCANPDEEIRSLLRFLRLDGLGADPALLKQIVAPVSVGRFKNHPDHGFTPDQLEAVRELGFTDTGS